MTMSIWTRQELLEQIALCKAAIKAAITGDSYTIDGRSLNRQKLEALRSQLSYLEEELAALDKGRGPVIVVARPRR